MSEELQGYGGGHIDDTDSSLRGKSGGAKFGLNTPVYFSAFGYKENVAAEGDPSREAIEIFVKQDEKEFKNWISPITKVYVKGPGNTQVETTDFSSADAKKKYNEEIAQQKGLLTHCLKAAGVAEAAIKAAAEQPAGSFREYAERMVALLPANYQSIPLDLFLEYQWKPSEGQSVTFLQMPKNLKGGYFLVPSKGGKWEERRNDKDELIYVNEQGQEHSFRRTKDFLESAKGMQTGPGATQAQPGDSPMSGPANSEPKKSTWSAT